MSCASTSHVSLRIKFREKCGKTFLLFPAEFNEYLNYCRSLRFEEKPDYMYLRQLIRNLFRGQGYSYDYVFDWNTRKEVNDHENENLHDWDNFLLQNQSIKEKELRQKFLEAIGGEAATLQRAVATKQQQEHLPENTVAAGSSSKFVLPVMLKMFRHPMADSSCFVVRLLYFRFRARTPRRPSATKSSRPSPPTAGGSGQQRVSAEAQVVCCLPTTSTHCPDK